MESIILKKPDLIRTKELIVIEKIKINGSIILSYAYCERETWYMIHRITPENDNVDLSIGRNIQKEFYEEVADKEIEFENMKIDTARKFKDKVLIGEVKKSKHSEKGAKIQLLFYIWKLKQIGIEVDGELLYPVEKRRQLIKLTLEDENTLEKYCEEIQRLAQNKLPEFTGYQKKCEKCAYYNYCGA